MANGLCRLNGDPLESCIDLGDQYISDFVSKENINAGEMAPLKVGFGATSRLVQLFDTVSPEKMYRKYWYRSGVNELMKFDLKTVVDSALLYAEPSAGDTVLDIASNDGTMLSTFPDNLNRIGIDPSDVAERSSVYSEHGMTIVNDFFSADAYRSATSAKAKIITVCAMFYDLEDPAKFLSDIREIIDETGVFVIQISYTPLSLGQNEFGNFAHEHLCYYTLAILKSLLEDADFEVFDVEMNSTNGGSLRVTATPKGSVEKLPCPLNLIGIGRARAIAALEYEKLQELDSPEPYLRFMERVQLLKAETIGWLERQAETGKKVVGYGASTKGNVLLQYYGLNTDLLPCIAERSEEKWGMYTIGTGIPIISEAEMRAMKPDYLFALPWFFINSFLKRESDLLDAGTRFVVPQPELRIIGG